jgi:hypothetical protein
VIPRGQPLPDIDLDQMQRAEYVVAWAAQILMISAAEMQLQI